MIFLNGSDLNIKLNFIFFILITITVNTYNEIGKMCYYYTVKNLPAANAMMNFRDKMDQ